MTIIGMRVVVQGITKNGSSTMYCISSSSGGACVWRVDARLEAHSSSPAPGIAARVICVAKRTAHNAASQKADALWKEAPHNRRAYNGLKHRLPSPVARLDTIDVLQPAPPGRKLYRLISQRTCYTITTKFHATCSTAVHKNTKYPVHQHVEHCVQAWAQDAATEEPKIP
jgi:hypothetical protein